MTGIIAFPLLLELSFFLIYDLLKNHVSGTPRFWIRIISAFSGILFITIDLILARPCPKDMVVADMLFAAAVLAMYPCSFEKPVPALKTSFAIVLSGGLAILYGIILRSGKASFRAQATASAVALMIVVFISCFALTAARRFKGIRLFFRSMAVWHSMEDYSRFLYSMGFLGICVFFMCSVSVPGDAGQVLVLICGGFIAVMYALLYMKAISGRTFLMDKDTEERVKDIIKGNLRTSYIDKAEEDRKMNNLYRKIMDYMTEDQPYLDPSFCMNDLAEKVYSNKLYLSRTINILSGRNFRQFVNYHRVQYAMGLFRKDPRMKVGEAATLSGFNSGVSFNMAFKVNTGKTPSEWLQEYVMETRDRL
ncbi:MAG: AraC family transcriptional regulator [Bacteroidales bacterium]|nr:AraC family transcriptional regulator [Bacteroidales bacterium]